MRHSKFFTNFISLCIIPSLIALPQDDIPNIQMHPQHIHQTASGGCIQLNNELFSYEDILELIEEIEEGNIEERCTPEEIEGINQFIAILAKEGILPGDLHQEFAVNMDIQELLFQNDNDYRFAYSLDGGHSIQPAVFYGQENPVLCKSWGKKQWDQTRKFVKKHKKEIIIGAAIVIAVAVTVTIIVVVCSSTTAGTAAGSAIGAAGGALADDSSESKPKESKHNHSRSEKVENTTVSTEPEIIEVSPIPLSETPLLMEVIAEQVNEFKDNMVVECLVTSEKSLDPESPSFTQNVKEYGIILAHKLLEETSEIVSVVPHLLDEIRDIGERCIPSSVCDLQTSDIYNPIGNFEDTVERGHQAIDNFFGVDQSQARTENQDNGPEFALGILPPPSALGSVVASEGKVAMTQVSSTCGWRVGQPIQNRTWWGGVPKWNTVRSRHWKNQAQLAKSNPNAKYFPEDISRMERGLAPQRINNITGQMESKELHHIPPQRDGGLFDFIEVWPDEHANLDPKRYLGR